MTSKRATLAAWRRVMCFVTAAGYANHLPAQGAPACTYDVCAFRLEGNSLLRGRQDEVVARLGFLSAPRLAPIFAPADTARAHAAVFDANYRSGRIYMIAGALLGGAAVVAAEQSRLRPRDRSTILLGVGGVGIIVSYVGLRKVGRANDALSRAIWWYNRSL